MNNGSKLWQWLCGHPHLRYQEIAVLILGPIRITNQIVTIQRDSTRFLAFWYKSFETEAKFRSFSKAEQLMQHYRIHLRLHCQWIPFLFCSLFFTQNVDRNHYFLTTPTYPTATWASFRAPHHHGTKGRSQYIKVEKKKTLSQQQLCPQTHKCKITLISDITHFYEQDGN